LSASPRPRLRRYRQIAEKLAAAITGGQYLLGDRLPAERELAKQFGMSRATVREALVALQNDGVLDVKHGSGVYVLAVPTAHAPPLPLDVDPFELTEARILFEGEVAALAATLITTEEIAKLETILGDMQLANRRGHGEEADRQFHQAIAAASRNRAMAAVIESLWAIRLHSPQCVKLFQRSRARGVKPVISEHRAILNALRRRDAPAARTAMQNHLRQVMNYLLDATESDALTAARAQASAQRHRFGARADGLRG
jgi:GntR family transcriptional regulator, hexuronate regulon transcriptional repressor